MIIRVAKRDSYTVMSNHALRNAALSFKARGILATLLSMPDDWQVYVQDLENRATDGRTAISSGIKELENEGYIRREQMRDEKGNFAGYQYMVYEMPANEISVSRKPVNGKPDYGKSDYGKSDYGKPATTNYLLNKELNEPITELTKDTPAPKVAGGNEHKEMVIALEKLTGMDMKIKSNAGQIVRAAKELREAGYSFQNVNEFGKRWQSDWRYKQDNKPPSLIVIKKEIGIVRAAPETQTDKFRKIYKETKECTKTSN